MFECFKILLKPQWKDITSGKRKLDNAHKFINEMLVLFYKSIVTNNQDQLSIVHCC